MITFTSIFPPPPREETSMTRAAQRRAAPADVTVSMVRWSGISAAVSAPLAGGLSWALVDRSWAGAVTGALGALLAGGTIATGAWAVRWLLQQERSIVLPGAFMIAVAQLVLLLAVVLVLRQQSWWEDTALAVGALVAVVAGQAALVTAYLTGPRPILEVEPW